MKGRPKMHPSPITASTTLPTSADGILQSRTAGDLAYQGMTIAAMLLLLVSLWVF
jgi:hypothetical protein